MFSHILNGACGLNFKSTLADSFDAPPWHAIRVHAVHISYVEVSSIFLLYSLHYDKYSTRLQTIYSHCITPLAHFSVCGLTYHFGTYRTREDQLIGYTDRQRLDVLRIYTTRKMFVDAPQFILAWSRLALNTQLTVVFLFFRQKPTFHLRNCCKLTV